MYTSKVALVIANTITTNAAITSYCSVLNFSSVRWASRYQIPKNPASNYQETSGDQIPNPKLDILGCF